MTDKELRYVAGIVDGEGCIRISLHYNRSGNECYSLLLSVHMCCKAVLERLQELIGYGHIHHTRAKNKNWRDSYRWELRGKRAYNLLSQVWPILVEKKEQALLAIEFQTVFPQRQGKIVTDEINLLRKVYQQRLQELKNRNISSS